MELKKISDTGNETFSVSKTLKKVSEVEWEIPKLPDKHKVFKLRIL